MTHTNMRLEELLAIRADAEVERDERAVRLVDEITRVYWATGDKLPTDTLYKPKKWRTCAGCGETFDKQLLSNGDRPMCRTCVKEHSTRRQDRRILKKTVEELGRAKTITELWNIVRAVALQYGSMQKFLEAYVDVLQDKDVAPTIRLKHYEATLRLNVFLEDAERAVEAEAAPQPEDSALVFDIHKRGKLLPVLRELFQMGAFTLDQIDPPPVETK